MSVISDMNELIAELNKKMEELKAENEMLKREQKKETYELGFFNDNFILTLKEAHSLYKKAFCGEYEDEEAAEKYNAILDNVKYWNKSTPNVADAFEVLCSFDYEATADKANKLGYTTGIKENPIDADKLMKDALEMFCDLLSSEEKNNYSQIGRLVAFKQYYDREDDYCFKLLYFIEMS